jgi:uncharacterized membrane protein YdcZ (DUF606 family)
LTVPVATARRRWLMLVGARLGGTVAAVFGLVLAARAPDLATKILGVALVLSALVVIAAVPAHLAHRWRSPEP